MSNENIDRFNKAASKWDENPKRLKMAKQIVERMAQEVTFDSSANVLDYGCGTGLVSLELAKLVGNVTGVDASTGMLDILNQKITEAHVANINTVVCEYSDPTFGKFGPFDMAVSSMVMHHIDNPAQFLSALYNVILPGGHVLIADLDEEDGNFHEDMTGVHHKGFSRDRFIETLSAAGFTEVRVTKAHTMTRETTSGLKDYTVLLAVGTKG